MKKNKERVIALDYFRGLCMLAVILNHSMVFSLPFAYLAGATRLWTGAAEIFLLLSGLTYGIVRGPKIAENFKEIVIKTWKRAAQIYLINILVVMFSIILGLFLISKNLPNNVLGTLPDKTGLSLLWSIINLSYTAGWAAFLMYYSVFLIFAPFLMRLLKSRFWLIPPLLSLSIFAFGYSNQTFLGSAAFFTMWQLYFVTGLVLARFRVQIVSTFYGLRPTLRRAIAGVILSSTALVVSVSVLLGFNLSPNVAALVHRYGILPVQFQAGYIHLLNHRFMLGLLLMDNRMGVLRPAVTLMLFASLYLVYQRYKAAILNRTGNFVTAFGRDTLWIFVAQAVVIPILALWPASRNLAGNALMTTLLIWSMWLVTKRGELVSAVRRYLARTQTGLAAFSAFIYSSEEEA